MRRASIIGLAVIASLALAGCGSSAHPAGPDPAPTPGGPLTGTVLASLLDTHVPAGFSRDASGTVDTGASFQDPSTGPVRSKAHCGDLNATAFLDASGDTGVAFAQIDYTDKSSNEIAQEIDSFANAADAKAALSALEKFFRSCASFTYKQDGDAFKVKVVTSAAAGLGAGAFKGVLTSAGWVGGTTLVAARVGPCVVTAFYSSQGKDDGADVLAIAATVRTRLVAALASS